MNALLKRTGSLPFAAVLLALALALTLEVAGGGPLAAQQAEARPTCRPVYQALRTTNIYTSPNLLSRVKGKLYKGQQFYSYDAQRGIFVKRYRAGQSGGSINSTDDWFNRMDLKFVRCW